MPRYDDSRWPLFIVQHPKTALSDREFVAYLDTIDRLFLRGETFALLMDARAAPVLTAKERQATAERMRASYARFPDLLVGLAIVLSSPIQRGIFTAIMWLAQRSHPTRAFATPDEGEAWLVSQLQAAGVRWPPMRRSQAAR